MNCYIVKVKESEEEITVYADGMVLENGGFAIGLYRTNPETNENVICAFFNDIHYCTITEEEDVEDDDSTDD